MKPPETTAITTPPQPLTAKEKRVMEFLENYLQQNGIAPSFQEIQKQFGWASLNSVQRYLQQLQNKNYIHIPGGNQKRAITLLHSSRASFQHVSPAHSLELPLLGRVAAGQPVEAVEHDEWVQAPSSSVRIPEKTYALRVEGDSMVNEGILDGDIIFVQKQSHANNGDTVVAMIDQEATVKKFYWHASSPENHVELRPANENMESWWYPPEKVNLQGLVVGLLRTF